MSDSIKIAVVDDHGLFRKGIVKLIKSLDSSFEVIIEASNGQDFLNRLGSENQPDLAIVDIDMPIMNGFETAAAIRDQYPNIHILILTMFEDEKSLIRMIRVGVKGYLSKDVEPEELKEAIINVSKGQFNYNKSTSGKLLQIIQSDGASDGNADGMNDREFQFLELCCSELTYKEIADQMCLSPKTIDGYRANLFQRYNAKSRVGLVLLAIKNGWVELDK